MITRSKEKNKKMANFQFIQTQIKDLLVVEPAVMEDARGYFMESYNYDAFAAVGVPPFVQDNESRSAYGVLRGMHFQINHPQGKLVRVLFGEVFDVAVDLRKGSASYGEWEGFYLSEENKTMLYVPEGFAHGFAVVSESAVFAYKCTRSYHPGDEGGFIYNDKSIGIKWPEIRGGFILSEKDKKLPPLNI